MKKVILLLFLHCFLSCSHETEFAGNLKKLYAERDISFDKATEFCIVLPEAGCSGYISGCIYQILTNKTLFENTQRKNLIVFTSINSKKMLRRNMQVDSIEEFNCVIDSLSVYLPEGNDRIYPLFIKLENGEIVDAVIQSPDTDINVFYDWHIINE